MVLKKLEKELQRTNKVWTQKMDAPKGLNTQWKINVISNPFFWIADLFVLI